MWDTNRESFSLASDAGQVAMIVHPKAFEYERLYEKGIIDAIVLCVFGE